MKRLFTLFSLCALLLLTTSAGKKKVTLYMVGDSTMADKTELEISPERGWGQLFPSYLTDNIRVANHAMNGRSTKSFVDEGRWQVILDEMQRGDIVIIQFGHNDTKKEDPRRYASLEDYQRNLMRMTEEAQKKGAHVILATPISRRYFTSDTHEFRHRHGGYPEAARRVAKRMNVPLLDMEQATADWLTGLGDEASKPYFMNVAPGECTKFPDGKIDNTHLRENGALVVGHMAAEMIIKQNIRPLKKYIDMEQFRAENPTPRYTTFCRPKFASDKTVRVESDMKKFEN